jgi:hypothetical protein
MHFLNPILLAAGLACIALPILIHILMRRRRRPIRWGAMEFLLQAYRQQRQRLRFEQWLLLGSRCLLVALIALAIGKPVFSSLAGSTSSLRARDLYLLLDNSLTSQTLSDSAPTSATAKSALELHKDQALALLGELDQTRGDRAALVLLGGPAESVVLPASSDLADVRRRIERTLATDSRADVAGALASVAESIADRSKNALETQGEPVLALLSDWRAGSSDTSRPLAAIPALAKARLLVPPPAPAIVSLDNVAITAVRPLRPVLVGASAEGPDAGSLPVRVELKRFATSPAITTLRAEIRDRADTSDPARIVTTTVTWAQGQSTESSILALRAPPVGETASRELIVVANIDRDAIAGDNTAAAAIVQRQALVATIVDDAAETPRTLPTPIGIESFSPADWMGLALDPDGTRDAWGASGGGGAGGVRVQRAEARDLLAIALARKDASGNPAALPASIRDSGVLILTRPDTLDAGAWSGVRQFAQRGGLVLITPPPNTQTHLWPDAMQQGLELDIEIARETKDIPGADGAGGLLRASDGALGTAQATAGTEDLLAMLRGELDELAKSVRVRKALSVTRTSSASQVLLSLEDGSPVLIATRLREGQTPRGWIVFWTVAPTLAWTDLPAKPLMVPLMQELVRQGAWVAGGTEQRSLLAGGSPASVQGATEWARVAAWRAEDDATNVRDTLLRTGDATPGSNLSGPVLRDAGVWSARGDGGQRLATLVVQADVAASDTTPLAGTTFDAWIAGLGAGSVVSLGADGLRTAGPSGAIGFASEVPPLSLPLLVAAGLVALLEVLLARWFSHAKASSVPDKSAPAGGTPA